MTTVPELKAEAARLGIKGTSKMRKPELQAAIAEAERVALASQAVTREVSMPTEAARKAARAEAARVAGSRAKVTAPLSNFDRAGNYAEQNGSYDKPVTPAQSRRMRKKGNRALKVS